MKTDTELLTWLESEGFDHALVSDDNGHWACVSDGIQNCPMGDEPIDIQTTFWIEKDKWHDSIRDAIRSAITATDATS